MSKEDREKPGPGAYEKNDEFGKNAVKYSIRGKSPEKIGNDVPGPGNYESDMGPTKNKIISYKMGSG